MNSSLVERVLPLKNMVNKDSILVHEIYASIQGESSFAGELCTFIRTTACHLRCGYCDTKQAFYHGTEKTIDDILQRVEELGIGLVEITGGEPLLQKPVFKLMQQLCDKNYQVLLETSGAVSISNVDRRVHVILDIKTPGSGEEKRNIWSNLDLLWPKCEVKFVICDRADYLFAKKIVQTYRLGDKCKILMSAEAGGMSQSKLAEWIIEDRLAARFQTQLHKVLWGNKAGV